MCNSTPFWLKGFMHYLSKPFSGDFPCPEKREKGCFSSRNAVCVFITIGGTLKVNLRVFDEKKTTTTTTKTKKKKNKKKTLLALNFVVCLRVGVLGTNISLLRSTENHSRRTSVGQPHMNIHILQLHLSFGNSILRVVIYCAFRSQNNSDNLLT